MPFVQIDVEKEINKRLDKDKKLRAYFEEACQEYELLKQLVEIRKKKGISQKSLAKIAGMSQQAISRIEAMGHSPKLSNFLRYVKALGCEIRIESLYEK